MDSIRTEITEQTFENFDKKFKVILADPPWSYQNGGRGSAAGEYSCMSLDDFLLLLYLFQSRIFTKIFVGGKPGLSGKIILKQIVMTRFNQSCIAINI